jgi:hypothetical protein
METGVRCKVLGARDESQAAVPNTYHLTPITLSS